eukprot:CAMPEP_0175157330 /NCGR_PEP_ID=MMETSP0087-20121206/22145_1 /TAXON_ID=136419 /ORGANISM="Unknown Unknown, Strain D1" /LENGTH=219 /DNA_ID=CAMNT_0016444933 /DNA_START=84 /DNA_END=740 /DNA_ORIENTATION=+
MFRAGHEVNGKGESGSETVSGTSVELKEIEIEKGFLETSTALLGVEVATATQLRSLRTCSDRTTPDHLIEAWRADHQHCLVVMATSLAAAADADQEFQRVQQLHRLVVDAIQQSHPSAFLMCRLTSLCSSIEQRATFAELIPTTPLPPPPPPPTPAPSANTSKAANQIVTFSRSRRTTHKKRSSKSSSSSGGSNNFSNSTSTTSSNITTTTSSSSGTGS